MDCSASRLRNPYQVAASHDSEYAEYAKLDLGFLKDEEEIVLCLAFNDAGAYLACGTAHGRLIVWDLASLRPALVVHHLHSKDVNSVAWVPRGKGRTVLTSSDDGRVRLFDLERRLVLGVLRFETPGSTEVLAVLNAQPDPTTLARCLVCARAVKRKVPWPSLYVFGGPKQCIVSYVPAKARNEDASLEHVAACFDRSGSLVFVGGIGHVHVFDAASGVELSTVATKSIAGWVSNLSLSRTSAHDHHDDRLVANTLTGTGKITVFRIASRPAAGVDAGDVRRLKLAVGDAGEVLHALANELQYIVDRHVRWIDVACSPSGSLVLALESNNHVLNAYIWDALEGSLTVAQGDKVKADTHNHKCAWHPWRAAFAVIYGGNLALWRAQNDAVLMASTAWRAFPAFVEMPVSTTGGSSSVNAAALDQATARQPVDVLARPARAPSTAAAEDSDDETSSRLAPRTVTRGIGYFVRATAPTEVKLTAAAAV